MHVSLSSAYTFVTRVAIDAVVDVPIDSAMLPICGGLGVAVGTGENGIVSRVGVAGGANPGGSAVVHIEPGVIEGGARPGSGVMAGSARGWESRGDVVGIGGGGVLSLV